MGVVVRQGLKSTIVQYAGVAFGVAALLFVYPRAQAVYGLIQVMIAAAQLLVPVAMLGSYALAVRYYPTFRTQKAGAQGLLTISVLLACAGFLLVLAAWPWLRALIVNHVFANEPVSSRQFLPLILPLVALIAFGRLFSQYAANFQRVVVPTILEQFAFKVVLPILVLLYLENQLSMAGVVYGTLIHYALVLLGLLLYLVFLGEFRLGRIEQPVWAERGEMAQYAGYSIAGHVSNSLAFQIDVVAVGAFLGFEAAGQYSLVRYIAEVIAKPLANLRTVTSGLVSSAWTRNDLPYLQTLYRKSSDNLLLVSGYVFGGMAVCYPALTQIASKGEVLAEALPTFLLLGLARLIDAATSINDNLIVFSQRYRFNLLALGILAAVSVVANLYLIPLYGLPGAGMAMVLAVGLYNLAKVLFAGYVFGLWPFGKTTFEVAVALVGSTLLAWAIPVWEPWWLSMALKGGLLSILLIAFVWWRSPSPELKALLQRGFGRMSGK